MVLFVCFPPQYFLKNGRTLLAFFTTLPDVYGIVYVFSTSVFLEKKGRTLLAFLTTLPDVYGIVKCFPPQYFLKKGRTLLAFFTTFPDVYDIVLCVFHISISWKRKNSALKTVQNKGLNAF